MNANTSLTSLGRAGLTVSRIQELIIAHKVPMKTKTIIQLVNDFSLTETDVDLLLDARAEYHAAPARIQHLLQDGFKATQINSLYEARERINSSLPADVNGISITKLVLIQNTFVGADCDADVLSEIVRSIFEAARERRPDASLEGAVHMACDVAATWGATMLETILEIIRKYGVTEPE